MELILFSFGVCFLSCVFVAIDWNWLDLQRKKDDPQLSSWLGWSQLSSIPEAEVFFRLLFRPNASSLPERTKTAVLRIRIAIVTLLFGITGWFVGYYLTAGSS